MKEQVIANAVGGILSFLVIFYLIVRMLAAAGGIKSSSSSTAVHDSYAAAVHEPSCVVNLVSCADSEVNTEVFEKTDPLAREEVIISLAEMAIYLEIKDERGLNLLYEDLLKLNLPENHEWLKEIFKYFTWQFFKGDFTGRA